MKIEIELSDVMEGLSSDIVEKFLSTPLTAALLVLDTERMMLEMVAVPKGDDGHLEINVPALVSMHEKLGDSIAKAAVATIMKTMTEVERN